MCSPYIHYNFFAGALQDYKTSGSLGNGFAHYGALFKPTTTVDIKKCSMKMNSHFTLSFGMVRFSEPVLKSINFRLQSHFI
jgi:hypothetical protein